MSLQTWIALIAAALAAGYFLRGAIQSFRKGDCSPGCGCCGDKACKGTPKPRA